MPDGEGGALAPERWESLYAELEHPSRIVGVRRWARFFSRGPAVIATDGHRIMRVRSRLESLFCKSSSPSVLPR